MREHIEKHDLVNTDPGWRDDDRFETGDRYDDVLEPEYHPDEFGTGPPLRVMPHADTILADMDAREWRQEEAERYAHPAERPVGNQPT